MKNAAHLRHVRSLPCCVCGSSGSVAHHMVGGGMGRKTSDLDTMPLCAEHHDAFHGLTGRFKGWTKAQLRAWQLKQIEAVWTSLNEQKQRLR